MKLLLLAGACFIAKLTAAVAAPCSVQNVRVSVKFVLDAANSRPTSGAYIRDDQIQAAIGEANTALANIGANWRIDLVEILDVPGISQWFGPLNCSDASSFRSMEAQAEANPNLYRWRTDAVNFYVISSLNGCGGLCSYPAGGDDMIWINSQSIRRIGWLHELGHYFNLVHTFEPNPAPAPCAPADCGGALGTCPDVCPDTFNVMSYNCDITGANAVFSSCQLSIMSSEMHPTTGRRRAVAYCTDLPSNDTCAGAIPMTVGTTYTISTTTATSSGDPTPNCLSTFGKGVWFAFTPAISGIVTINTCTSDFDTAIGAYTGGCASLTPVSGACNNSQGPSCATTRASVSFAGTAGTTYRILAGGFGGSSGTLSIVGTVRLTQTITFSPVGDKTLGDPPFPLSATASSGLGVSFSIVSGPATIAGNVVRVHAAGMVTVRASQRGDSTYYPAPDVDQAFTVLKANQAIIFGPLDNRSLGEPPFRVDAVADSGMPVVLSILSGPATISSNLVTLLNTGSVTVRTSQSGDANFNPAPNMDQSFYVHPRPSMTISPRGESVLVTWPTNVGGYVLESAPSLAPPVSWHTVLSNPVIVDGWNSVTVSAIGNAFYRLRK